VITVETLPVDTRRGCNCELRLTETAPSETPWAVGLFPIGDEIGIAIGVGGSRVSALADALDTLQAARWAIDDAILEAVKR
jgi:formylmethanofuran:tetrahydromethanopterin formyltransferase